MIIFNPVYGVYNDVIKGVVEFPSPVDPLTLTSVWLYDRVAMMAPHLKRVGYSHVLLPPPFDAANLGAGYNMRDDYGIGDKLGPNRAGTADQLRRCIAICAANGLTCIIDFVTHQYSGGKDEGYTYPASGGPTAGRFPKFKYCFVGGKIKVDDVVDSDGNYPFGDEAVYEHCLYMWDGKIASLNWLIETLGDIGLRWDDAKGTYGPFLHTALTQGAAADKWCFAELYTAGPPLDQELEQSYYGIRGRCSALDFTTHYHGQDVFDGGYPMSHLFNGGLIWEDPMKGVSFRETRDTNTSFGQGIANDALIMMAYMIASPGAPMIYGRDYFSDPNCYGMGSEIDKITWVGNSLAYGPANGYEIPDTNGNVAVIIRSGWPGLVMCLNKDTWNGYWVTVQTSFGPNVELHDYLGHIGNVWTDGGGRVRFWVPSNAYSKGQNSVALSLTGITGKPYPAGRSITQMFEGAEDMIIPAVPAGGYSDCGRIWVAAGRAIKTTVNSNLLSVSIVDVSGTDVGGPDGVPTDGWYIPRVYRGADGGETKLPFKAYVTYTAPAEADLVP